MGMFGAVIRCQSLRGGVPAGAVLSRRMPILQFHSRLETGQAEIESLRER